MNTEILLKIIDSYPDFPKKGILFKDILPIFANPEAHNFLIEEMSSSNIIQSSEAIIAVDARGFLIGSSIALKLSKPLIVARKPGKLPGETFEEKYDLEYGSNTLCIQKKALENFDSFSIVDDLLATGGTVNSIANILKKNQKKVTGLSVIIQLSELKGKDKFDFPVDALIDIN